MNIEKTLAEIKTAIKSNRERDNTFTAGVLEDAYKIIQKLKDTSTNNGWIPISERLPKEHASVFAKFKGTDKWNNAMFEKISDIVNVTVVDESGEGVTTHAHLVDGKWSCDLLKVNKAYRITAWQPLPEPYKEGGGE